MLTRTIINYKGAKLHYQRGRDGYYSREYIVTLLFGEWPSDHELIRLVGNRYDYEDDDVLPRENFFGGAVEGSGNVKTVHVYDD